MGSRETQGPKTPLDRLVEAGLAAYGRGEVDDALVAWEQALAIDPEDPRALGYVDYVRQHYELVSGATAPVAEEELGVPFGIGEDVGDYEVEVTVPRQAPTEDMFSQTVRLTSPPILDALDEGWNLEDDVMSRAHTIEHAGMTLELEADEPPDFEGDRTAEYPTGPRKRQANPSSPGFLPGEHPTDPATDEFATLEATTGLGQRALGFVQPTGRARRASRPELKVNIRTPNDHDRPDSFSDAPPSDPEGTSAMSLENVPLRASSEGDEDELGPALGEEVPVSQSKTLDFGSKSESPTRELPPVSQSKTQDFGSKSEGPTRDLAIRSRSQDERHAAHRFAASIERDLRADTVQEPSRTRTADARAKIVAEVDRNASGSETPDQRTRRRIAGLIVLAQAAAKETQLDRAVLAIDAAFAEDPDSALAHKLIQQNREAIFGVFHDYIGDLDRRPQLRVALHDVLDEPLDSRAAFLLSRVDGTITFEELLDVSGMPRLEAGRYLCQLVMRGLLAAD